MGGGGSKARAKTTISNQIISQVLTKNFLQYSTSISQEQVLYVSGSYNVIQDVVQNQAINIDAQTISGSNIISNMQADMSNQLQQAASAQSQAVMSALNASSKSEVDAAIRNTVKNVMSEETIVKIAVGVNQLQGIYVTGDHNIVKSVSQRQLGDMVQKAVREVTQQSNVLGKIDNAIAQETTATQENPLTVITDWLDSVGNTMGKTLGIGELGMWAPILLFIIVVALIYVSGRNRSPGLPYVKPISPVQSIQVA